MVPFSSKHQIIKVTKAKKKKKSVHKKSCNILKIPFKIKGVELLNLPRFFNEAFFASSIPKELPTFKTPSVIFTVEKCIQIKNFNFNVFVSSLDFYTSVRGNSISG